MTIAEIQLRIANAKDLDLGTVIDECIQLYKKFWGQGLLTILIISLLTIPIALLSSFLLEMFGLVTPNEISFQDFQIEDLSGLFGFNLLYNIPFTIITTSIQIAVLGGFYRMIKIKDIDNSTKEDYFYFFKTEYFGKIIMLAIVYAAIGLVAQLLCFIPYIYAIVPMMYFSVMFAFNSEKSVEEIFKTCFLLGNKKWLVSFGSLIVCLILGMLGLIACVIGVLFTISIVYLPCYVIYKNVIGFDDESELDQIGKFQEF